jgi:hypothetical protein
MAGSSSLPIINCGDRYGRTKACEPLAHEKAIIQYFRVDDEYLTGIRMIFPTYHR